MKANGKMENKMVKVKFFSLINLNLKVFGKMEKFKMNKE
jgi:hypothetical protein